MKPGIQEHVAWSVCINGIGIIVFHFLLYKFIFTNSHDYFIWCPICFVACTGTNLPSFLVTILKFEMVFIDWNKKFFTFYFLSETSTGAWNVPEFGPKFCICAGRGCVETTNKIYEQKFKNQTTMDSTMCPANTILFSLIPFKISSPEFIKFNLVVFCEH